MYIYIYIVGCFFLAWRLIATFKGRDGDHSSGKILMSLLSPDSPCYYSQKKMKNVIVINAMIRMRLVNPYGDRLMDSFFVR